ncbi:hypothetical protein EAI_09271 [Harpegnathos saltator]|uniref:Uncharacterized protein n=1 Tax=Harpegnathos saltator TaxID=610380 RepID=E2BPU6_HARSA|nr:hypothetical protein EAI_09271 [Harpegnathos saltator]
MRHPFLGHPIFSLIGALHFMRMALTIFCSGCEACRRDSCGVHMNYKHLSVSTTALIAAMEAPLSVIEAAFIYSFRRHLALGMSASHERKKKVSTSDGGAAIDNTFCIAFFAARSQPQVPTPAGMHVPYLLRFEIKENLDRIGGVATVYSATLNYVSTVLQALGQKSQYLCLKVTTIISRDAPDMQDREKGSDPNNFENTQDKKNVKFRSGRVLSDASHGYIRVRP